MQFGSVAPVATAGALAAGGRRKASSTLTPLRWARNTFLQQRVSRSVLEVRATAAAWVDGSHAETPALLNCGHAHARTAHMHRKTCKPRRITSLTAARTDIPTCARFHRAAFRPAIIVPPGGRVCLKAMERLPSSENRAAGSSARRVPEKYGSKSGAGLRTRASNAVLS